MTKLSRATFVATILLGSFLLFLVQPLVARMALPLLGGAPNVWNSAMVVYQALLLGGYAYAHWLASHAPRRQAQVQIGLLLVALLTLPIALIDLPRPAPGWEVVWVPALIALSVGPVFFLVSAQAPLIQRWYASNPQAGDPYWLYAASNIGSFAGLLAYPLLLEPTLSLEGQSWVWSAGYAVLIALTAWAARGRRQAREAELVAEGPSPSRERIAQWLALSAVPSGLMLSTTTHLTTDIVAVPLLWVLPLGLYLLSFVLAFNPRSQLGFALARSAPIVLLLAGSMAMVSNAGDTLSIAFASVLMLLVVATALHRHLYELRPEPARLTLFYLVMSMGGVIGGLFTAILAPLLFDWVWEHPLLVLAAAALLPPRPLLPLLDRLPEPRRRTARLVLVLIAALLGWWMIEAIGARQDGVVLALTVAIAALGLLALGARWALVAILAILMLARGGFDTLTTTLEGERARSYFGIYTVATSRDGRMRELRHGSTLHGKQLLDPALQSEPTTYYGRTAGIGLALRALPQVAGPDARVGVVGLGVGTLACYRQPGQRWTFFEIDPLVARYSRTRDFTFLERCAPDARIAIGDARLELAEGAADAYDLLAVDAFSSDAIPLHLVTREAFDIYDRALAEDGLLLLHISNRYIDLGPVLAAHAKERGWLMTLRDDPASDARLSSSLWVMMARDAEPLAPVLRVDPDSSWSGPPPPAERTWTDDHASILPFLIWENVLGSAS